MSSPFSSISSRAVPTWSDPDQVPVQPSQFSLFNLVDAGYGSGGYGDNPYGTGTITIIHYTVEWTPFTDR